MERSPAALHARDTPPGDGPCLKASRHRSEPSPDLLMRDRPATSRSVTRLGERGSDLPLAHAPRREPARCRDGLLHVGIRFEVHTILGELEARRYCTDALTASSLGVER